MLHVSCCTFVLLLDLFALKTDSNPVSGVYNGSIMVVCLACALTWLKPSQGLGVDSRGLPATSQTSCKIGTG